MRNGPGMERESNDLIKCQTQTTILSLQHCNKAYEARQRVGVTLGHTPAQYNARDLVTHRLALTSLAL